ncbi:MAG: alpha/beta hydrolase [Gaiellaceae bacterium]
MSTERAAASDGGRRPVVTDEEFFADEKFVLDGMRPATIEGWSTRIHDEGQGDPIVFVPILGGLEVVYAKQLRELAKTNRVILHERTESLDRRVPVGPRVDEIRKVLDHLEIERAHLVGLGEAGITTYNFGREHPDRVRSLTVICCGPLYRVKPYWLTKRIVEPAIDRLPVEYLLPDSLILNFVIKTTSGNGPLPPHLIAHMVERVPKQMRVHKFSVAPIENRHNMYSWAHTLRMPVLLINRDDDKVAAVEDMAELAKLLPQCYGYEILHDGGRFVTYTWADRVNELLRDFYAKVNAGVSPPAAVRSR